MTGKCCECSAGAAYRVIYADGEETLLCGDHYSRERFRLRGVIKL